MKPILFLISIVCLAGLLACGSGKTEWWNEPPYFQDSITAVGTAQHSPNTAIMRRQAETDARMAVARIIDTQVQELIKNWAQQNQSSIAEQSVYNEYFESVGRAITNQNLPGVWIQKYQFDKKTNAQYALGIFKRHQVVQVTKEQLEAYRQDAEAKKQEERMFKSRQEAERAFSELDALIEKQLGPQP